MKRSHQFLGSLLWVLTPYGHITHNEPWFRKNHNYKKGTCIMCGKEKNHNNSFCSAECCKQYQSRRK